jgi:hypothetical protein
MKRKDVRPGGPSSSHAGALELNEWWPNLAEFLTAAAWEGCDEVRESPTVTFWAQGGQWRASLRDRAEGLVLWLVADSLNDLLTMADGLCLDSSAHWRHDQKDHERNGKRQVKRA